jgi:hypothetical protein
MEHYPVFVKEGEDVRDVFARYHNKNMQQVKEIRDLSRAPLPNP